MKLAFIFPGQGMQEPRMPELLRRTGPEWRCLEDILGAELLRAAERGGAALERTDVLQPVLVAACVAIAARLREAGVRPAVVAGHSIGELAAWAVAASLPAKDAVALAAARGRLMAREASQHAGGMLALQEASRAAAEAAIALGRRHGVVALAAVNAPAQWVLSGELPALDAIAAQFPSRRLPVAGAWHCPLMAAAVPEFLGELRALTPGPLKAALILNRSGRALGKTDDLCEALAGQLVRPVQWAASLETLDSLAVTDIVTVGPGRILRGLIRKNIGTRVRVHTTEDDADVERTVQRLRGALNDSEVSL